MNAMLKEVPFKGFANWSVQHLLKSTFSYANAYPLVPIREFLRRTKIATTIEDDVFYKRLKIKIKNGGVTLRDEIHGRNIGTKKQYLAKAGNFVMSKIDARNGAYGIVPDVLDGAILTNDFPAFSIDQSKIHPDFFVLLTTTDEFLRFAQSCSSGTTGRQRIDMELFLDTPVPLPPLSIQQDVVERFRSSAQRVSDLESQITLIEKKIREYLYGILGITPGKTVTPQDAYFLEVSFKDMSRWDSRSLLRQNSRTKSSYPTKLLDELILNFMHDGTTSLRFNPQTKRTSSFSYIGMENVEKHTGRLLNPQTVKGADIKSQTVLLPKGYFIFGKLRPYLNKYLYNRSNNTYVCSSEFFVFNVRPDLVLNEYLEVILFSGMLIDQSKHSYSGARMPRISEATLRSIEMVVPPIAIQQQIADRVAAMRRQVDALVAQIKKSRDEATTHFQEVIFS